MTNKCGKSVKISKALEKKLKHKQIHLNKEEVKKVLDKNMSEYEKSIEPMLKRQYRLR